MKVFAGYGSTKDISVYSSIGLSPSHIYIVGRPTKKMQHQCQVTPSSSLLLWVKKYGIRTFSTEHSNSDVTMTSGS